MKVVMNKERLLRIAKRVEGVDNVGEAAFNLNMLQSGDEGLENLSSNLKSFERIWEKLEDFSNKVRFKYDGYTGDEIGKDLAKIRKQFIKEWKVIQKNFKEADKYFGRLK